MNGAIAWFARNAVAANLLMLFIFVLGLQAALTKIPIELFPSITPQAVTIQAFYRGASPAEVETAVLSRIEDAIADVEGIDNIKSSANEGSARAMVELIPSADPNVMKDLIKTRIDALTTLPDDVDTPIVSLIQRRREVISVVLHGNLSELDLRTLADEIRDELNNLSTVSVVELAGVRNFEISIEVSEKTLRQYNLTLEQVADAIKRSSQDVPSGSIKTTGGEILLRTLGQAYSAEDFGKIVLLTREDGTRITIGDIAEIRDGFEEASLYAEFNGISAAELDVYRSDSESAIKVGDQVKDYIEEKNLSLPDGIKLDYWRDRSRYVKLRLETLMNSAWQGGLLIFILLAMFLRLSVAIWVCVGIPISVFGALAIMPLTGSTFNLISLFAFILVLGIVVDDAIVTGENIYTRMKTAENSEQAAIEGTQEVAVPVTFGILTTIAAFIPLAVMEGPRGPMFSQIPMIVIPVLLFSLVESKLILPAHMKHVHLDHNKKPGPFSRMQRAIADGLEKAIHKIYRPILSWTLRNRYLTATIFIAVSLIVGSFVVSGRYGFTFFPRIQSETARMTLQMPLGTPLEITEKHLRRISSVAAEMRDDYVDPESNESIIKQIMTQVGQAGGSRSGGSSGSSHLGRVMFEMVPPEERSLVVQSSDVVRDWRKRIGKIPGAKELTFRAEIGRSGDPIDVQLQGRDFVKLEAAAAAVREYLGNYSGVFDIKDSFEDGKEEIKLSIKPNAEQLGLNLGQLGAQVRNAFFGAEAQRIQRDGADVRVMVRYPREERRSVDNLESMMIRTPDGNEIPFSVAANVETGRGFSKISRVNRDRTVNVTADINKEAVNINQLTTDLNVFMPEMIRSYPGVKFTLEGEQREQKETNDSLKFGGIIVLFAIYSLLAIPFRSYVQPLIVMSIIPFSLIGAVVGHMIMGMNLSIMSLMGMLALAGVVVNDSLVLVDYINRRRREGTPLMDAVRNSGVARFRPILLTSLTTFFGLAPLMMDKSTQAQFLIPMAISLGFGILFATFLTLILIPVSYLVLEDIRAGFKYLWYGKEEQPAEQH